MTRDELQAIRRYLPLLAREWGVEAALCAVLAALLTFLAPLWWSEPCCAPLHEALFVGLAAPILTMGTRFILHIPWVTVVRFRMAQRHGFRLWRTLLILAGTYVIAYLVGIMLTAGLLLLAWIGAFETLVAPSFLAALLAPTLLYWRRGEIFDSAVAKAAERNRSDAARQSR
ncbi:MAG: hypothetical protein NXI21_18965 [Alphaproteobacteria bacterium]|nr:hypothetical protein [Alphaproteobacteria bacterium]